MAFLDTNFDGKLDQSDAQAWVKNTVDVLVTDTKLSAGLRVFILMPLALPSPSMPGVQLLIFSQTCVHRFFRRVFWSWFLDGTPEVARGVRMRLLLRYRCYRQSQWMWFFACVEHSKHAGRG